MFIKYTIDLLNENSVSVEKRQYTTVDNIEYPIGQPHRKAYINSTKGREEVVNELPLAQQNSIFAIWGDTSTVTQQDT